MASEVGQAYVTLIPSAKGFAAKMQSELAGDVAKAGDATGKQYGEKLTASAAAKAGEKSKNIWASLGKGAAVAGVAAGVAVGKLMGDSISAAGDYNETISKVGAIFGKDAVPALEQFASSSADTMGQSKQQVLDAASTFAIFGKAAGLGGQDLTKFSQDFTGLSSDLASFHNTSPEQAIEAIGAALRGESEPIRAFGVMMDDASLKAQAMAMGLLKPVKNAAAIKAANVQVTASQLAYNAAVGKYGKGSIQAQKAEAGLGTARAKLKKETEGSIGTLTQSQKTLAAQGLIMKQTKDAQGDFAKTSGGLANQQRILSASFANTKTQIGQNLLPVALKAATWANDMIPKVTALGTSLSARLGPALQSVGGFIQTAFGFLSQHTGTVQIMAGVIGVLVAATYAHAAALGISSGALKAWVVQTKIVSAATKAWAAVQWILNSSLLANPITWIVIGIAALIGAIVLVATKTQFFQKIWAAVWGGATAAASAVAGWFTGTFVPALTGAWAWIVNGVKGLWAAVSGAFSSVVSALGTFLSTVVAWGVKLVMIWTWPYRIAIALIIAIVASLVKLVWPYVQAFVSRMVTGFQNIWTRAVAIFNAVRSFLGSVWKAIAAVVLAVGARIRAGIMAVWNAVYAVVSSVVNRVRSVVSSVWNAIAAVVSAVGARIRSVVSAAWNAVSSVVSSVVGRVRSAVSAGFNAVLSAVSGPVNRLRGIVSGAFSAALGAITGAIGRARSAAASVGSAITGAVSGIVGQMGQIGSNIVHGIINGITGMAGTLASSVRSFIHNNVPAVVRKLLGIESPSKVFEQIGKYTIEGLVKGLTGNSKSVLDASTKIVTLLKAGFSNVALTRSGIADSVAKETGALNVEIKRRAAAVAKLHAVQRGTLKTTGSGKRKRTRRVVDPVAVAAAKANVAAYDNQIRGSRKKIADLRASDKALARLTKARQNRLMATVKADAVKLKTLTGNRDRVAAKLVTAQSNLVDLRKKSADLNASLRDSMKTNVVVSGARNAGDIVYVLQNRLAQVKKFSADLAALAKNGLSKSAIEQIAAAGMESGGATAAALASASAAQIKTVNSLQGQIDSAATKTADTMTNSLYGSGIRAAEGLVKGLASQQKAIEGQMLRIAQAMQGAIKKALGIKSPSKVFQELGSFSGQGLVVGLLSEKRNVAKAGVALAGASMAGASAFAPGSAAGAGAGAPTIRVFIGDRELTDIVRTEVDNGQSDQARQLSYGRRV